MTCGIYKITNKVNGKMYIGQSVDIEKRWKHHRNTKRLGHLYSAFKKHGLDNFTFSIICEVPESALDEYEISYIKYYETTDKTKGYNKTFGGEGGRKTDETKQKMSTAKKNMTEETKKKLSTAKKGVNNPIFGKIHTEESKKKMATRCVQCYYMGKMFNSKKEICIEFNLTYRQLDRIFKSQSAENRPS